MRVRDWADSSKPWMAAGMRPVSVTMFHCIHSTHSLVFKVTITMLSSDGGGWVLSRARIPCVCAVLLSCVLACVCVEPVRVAPK